MHPSLGQRVLVAVALLSVGVCTLGRIARAKMLDARALDQAVVRVIALGTEPLVEFSSGGTTAKESLQN